MPLTLSNKLMSAIDRMHKSTHIIIRSVPLPMIPPGVAGPIHGPLALSYARVEPGGDGRMHRTQVVSLIDSRFIIDNASLGPRLNRSLLDQAMTDATGFRSDHYPDSYGSYVPMELLTASAATLLLHYAMVPDVLFWSVEAPVNSVLRQAVMTPGEAPPHHALRRLIGRFACSGLLGLLDLSAVLAAVDVVAPITDLDTKRSVETASDAFIELLGRA